MLTIDEELDEESTAETQPEAITRYICRHIFTDGRRCGSVCLRHEQFCYYHHTARRPVANPKQRRRRSATFDLPLIEDRGSIQSCISEVLRRIAANELDPRRAGLLLYGLQIAGANMPRHAPSRNMQDQSSAEEQVEKVILDPQIGPVAPPAIYQTAEEKREEKSFTRQLLDEVNELNRRNDEEYYRSQMEAAQSRIDDANRRADDAQAQIKELQFCLEKSNETQGVFYDQLQAALHRLETSSTVPAIQAVAMNHAPGSHPRSSVIATRRPHRSVIAARLSQQRDFEKAPSQQRDLEKAPLSSVISTKHPHSSVISTGAKRSGETPALVFGRCGGRMTRHPQQRHLDRSDEEAPLTGFA